MLQLILTNHRSICTLFDEEMDFELTVCDKFAVKGVKHIWDLGYAGTTIEIK